MQPTYKYRELKDAGHEIIWDMNKRIQLKWKQMSRKLKWTQKEKRISGESSTN